MHEHHKRVRDFLHEADRAAGRIRTKARVKAAEEKLPLESPSQDWPRDECAVTTFHVWDPMNSEEDENPREVSHG